MLDLTVRFTCIDALHTLNLSNHLINMTVDTIHLNQDRQSLESYDEIWLFGYGSLIYKVDFPYIEKQPAHIIGWQRRFWQGSHDHRGTPEHPGRVVTLIESHGARCDGMAFQVTPQEFVHLDHREKNGYLRHEVPMFFNADTQTGSSKLGLIYIADEANEAYLGADSERNIATHIAHSCGPSGENSEYVIELANSLRAMNVWDEHVFEIERYLLAAQS